jgi:hypothetical protein
MNRTRRALLLAAIGLPLSFAPAMAQQNCAGEEFRQFDFWVGSWEVTARGVVAGRNEVTLEEGGCVLHEHWSGSKGGTGQSFNIYDRGEKLWHQFWVDNSGTVLHLSGGLSDGVMLLAGTTTTAEGERVHQRLRFTPNPDGTVRQLWEQSPDGERWSVVFDGLYRRQ